MLTGMICTTAFADDSLTTVEVSTTDDLVTYLEEEGDYEIIVQNNLSFSSFKAVYVGAGTKVLRSVDGQTYNATGGSLPYLYIDYADTDLTVKDFGLGRVYLENADSTLTLSGNTSVSNYFYVYAGTAILTDTSSATYRLYVEGAAAVAKLTGSATAETVRVSKSGALYLSDSASVVSLTNLGNLYVSGSAAVGELSLTTSYPLTVSDTPSFDSLTYSTSSGYANTSPLILVSGSVVGATIPVTIGSNSSGRYYDGTSEVLIAQGTDNYTLTAEDLTAFSVELIGSSGSMTVGGYSLHLDEENNQIVYGPDGSGWTIDLSVNGETLEMDEDGNYTITATKDNYNTGYTTADSVKAVSALIEPDVIVTDNEGNILTEGTDYTVSYATTATSSSTGLNTAQVTVTNLTDSSTYTITYYIQQMNASDSGVTVGDVEMEFVTVITNQSWAIYPGYELFMNLLEVCDSNGNELTGLSKFYRDEESGSIAVVEGYNSANYDYTVSVGLTEVGSTKFTVTFQGVYYGTMTGTLTLTARDLSNAEVTIDDAYWTGEAVEPTPYVTYTDILGNENILTEGTDYTVSYENNIDFGTATVTISAVDGSNYTGETTTAFSIVEAWDQQLPVENQLELREALEAGYEEITVGANFALSSPVEITYDVTLKSVDGESYAITSRGMSKTDSMLVVSDRASLTLEDITIDGNDQTGLLYVSSGGTATVGDGATLTGGYHNTDYGAALYVEEGAEVTVSGTIRDTYGQYAIYNNGILNIQDGAYLTHLGESTSGYAALLNTSTGILNWSGGSFDADMDEGYYKNPLSGTLIRNTGEFNLSGGTINGFLLERDENGDPVLDVDGNYTYSDSERTSVYFGAVLNAKAGTFNMTGGTIQGFEATGDASSNSYGPSGAGVYNAGTFNLSGGLITENVCTGSTSSTASGQGNNYTSSSSGSGMGGGVYNAGVFTMSGGTISNNSAALGGGVYNAGARNLTNSYSEDAGQFYMTGGTITGNSVFSETVYNASSGSGSGMMGGKGTLVAGVGSALYVGGGSTTVLSGGTIKSDQVNTVETTDSDGNTVEETVSVGIAVVPTINSSGNASGSSFTATVATNSNLTVQDGADIQVGIVLVNTSTVYMSAVLNIDTYRETEEIIWSGATETSRTGDTNGLAYLLLDGKIGSSLELNVAALSVDSVSYSFSNVSATGSELPTSYTQTEISLNYDGALVAAYDDGVTTDKADADRLVLTANGNAVDTSEAALYLSTYAISDDTTADAWVICTHTQTVENEDGTTSETHTWGEGVETSATCTEYGCITYTCTICGATYAEVIPATGHSYTDAVTDPTCTEQGYTTHTCSVCGDVYVDTYVSAAGHTYSAPTFTWSEDYSAATATFTCEKGDTEAEGYTQTVDCTVTSATDEDGATAYTAICTLNGETYTDTKTVSASGETAHTHTYEGTVEVTSEATCTQTGEIVVTVSCTECGDVLYTYTIEVPATNHTYGEGTETVAATRYTQGMTTYTCTECGETKTEYTNKVNATFLFDDVLNDSQYYFIPVYWAYDLGITSGTSATLFSPSQGCTRAQFVTFLYRLAQATGENTSIGTTSTAFTDVDSDDYFYAAVLWAAENSVTSGTSETTFTPNRTITRREAITMLYRYECAVNETPTVETENPFGDVTTSDYAYTAILWAVEQGITSGTSETTFSPANTCTRAMMVTFLYNYAAIQD